MVALVTLEEMKVQLRIFSDAANTEIETWIEAAHGRVLRHIKASDEQVAAMNNRDQQAIKVGEILAVKALYEGAEDAPMTPAVLMVLHDLRDPSLA